MWLDFAISYSQDTLGGLVTGNAISKPTGKSFMLIVKKPMTRNNMPVRNGIQTVHDW